MSVLILATAAMNMDGKGVGNYIQPSREQMKRVTQSTNICHLKHPQNSLQCLDQTQKNVKGKIYGKKVKKT